MPRELIFDLLEIFLAHHPRLSELNIHPLRHFQRNSKCDLIWRSAFKIHSRLNSALEGLNGNNFTVTRMRLTKNYVGCFFVPRNLDRFLPPVWNERGGLKSFGWLRRSLRCSKRSCFQD